MQAFQEDAFNPGQVIFRERGELTHVYLIVDGQVKLSTVNNPIT
jgi:CRP-like cAMP-binding protein